jgi:hypothetical protein
MNSREQKEIKESLARGHACYVLITCDEPTEGGDMQVQMTYEGDANLASYLLQGAQTMIEDDVEEQSLS